MKKAERLKYVKSLLEQGADEAAILADETVQKWGVQDETVMGYIAECQKDDEPKEKAKGPKRVALQLQPEVAEKYECVGIRPAKYDFYGFGEIDLCSINLAKAKALAEKDFPYLKKK